MDHLMNTPIKQIVNHPQTVKIALATLNIEEVNILKKKWYNDALLKLDLVVKCRFISDSLSPGQQVLSYKQLVIGINSNETKSTVIRFKDKIVFDTSCKIFVPGK